MARCILHVADHPNTFKTGVVVEHLPFDASCATHERRDSRKNEMRTLPVPVFTRSRFDWPLAHLRRAPTLKSFPLEIRLVLPAQHAVYLVHVASDSPR